MSESLSRQNPGSPFRRAPSSVIPRSAAPSTAALPLTQETEELLRIAKDDIQRLREKEELKVLVRVHVQLCVVWAGVGVHQWAGFDWNAWSVEWLSGHSYMVIEHVCVLYVCVCVSYSTPFILLLSKHSYLPCTRELRE